MTDHEIDILMDRAIGRVWDEGRCRVCGFELPISRAKCLLYPHIGIERRADDPLPHTTSWEQVAKDREMMADELHDEFTDELWKMFWTPDAAHVNMIWLMVNATPRQQCIAWLRAHGERIEE